MTVNICPNVRKQFQKRLRRASKRKLLDISSYDSDAEPLPSRTAELPLSTESISLTTSPDAPDITDSTCIQRQVNTTSGGEEDETVAGGTLQSMQSYVTCTSQLPGAEDLTTARSLNKRLRGNVGSRHVSISSDYGSNEESVETNSRAYLNLKVCSSSSSKSLRLQAMNISEQLRSLSSFSCGSSQPLTESGRAAVRAPEGKSIDDAH